MSVDSILTQCPDPRCRARIPAAQRVSATEFMCPSCGRSWNIPFDIEQAELRPLFEEPRKAPLAQAAPVEGVSEIIKRIPPPDSPFQRESNGVAQIESGGQLLRHPSLRSGAGRVFISHSSRDRHFVEEELIGLLDAYSIQYWDSRTQIRTADYWERTILKGLQSCDWFLVVMSRNSAKSEWVKDELHWALEERPGRVVPVLLEDCDPADFHIRMRRIQWIDFRRHQSEGRRKLVERLYDASSETYQKEHYHPLIGRIRSYLSRLVCPAKP